MQGFVNLAADFGTVIALLIPLICYVMGGGLVIASIYGFWQWLNPAHPRRHPWAPFAAFLMAGTLLSYDRILNSTNHSFGGGVTTSLSGQLTSYAPPTLDANGLVGATPEDTLLNIITAFENFFEAYGALIVLFGLIGLYEVTAGNRSHTMSKPIVQLVFGIGVMNVVIVATAVMNAF